MNDKQKYLFERYDVVPPRVEYLQETHKIKNENDERPIFYFDRRWNSQNHSFNYIWHHSIIDSGLKLATSRRGRIILLHTGPKKTWF